MANALLERYLELESPISEVFPFFADAANLESLTPPWLSFAIQSSLPVPMAVGTRIDYRLRLHGIPIPWRSEISVWDPPHCFVDRQIRGPYRTWIHEHRFESTPSGGTRVIDRVQYDVLGGSLVRRLFVDPDLERIFAYRHQQLRVRFGEAPVVTGAGRAHG